MSKIHCKHDALRDVNELEAYERNRNQHTPEQIERLSKLLAYQGIRSPIVVVRNVAGAVYRSSSTIAKGHGTLAAMKLAGCPYAPVVYQDFDNEEQLYAYVQSDNAIQAWAELDLAAINIDVPELGPDFDIDMLGIDGFAIDMSEKNDSDADAIPEPPKVAKSKLGELWILGEHRLLAGDATRREDVERLMGGQKAILWSSDPPYGINHVSTSQEKKQSKHYKNIENDDLQFDELKKFLETVIRNCIDVGLEHKFAFYMWHAMKMQSYAAAAAAAAAAAGILFHRQIIWVKPSLVFGRGHYHWRHELCLMGWLQGNECAFYGKRNQTTIWEIGRENDKVHPTQKPVAITEIPILNHTKPKEIVLDPFLGSGSTLIGAEKTGRRGFGLEIEPAYVDVILSRWAKYTGKDPVREDGKKWSELCSQ